MNYLWSDEQKQVILNDDGSAPISAFCYYNQKIYAIRDNQLICFNCDDGSKSELSTPVEFIHVVSNYGHLFAISRANELFYFDAQSDEFQPLNVLSSGYKCAHGTQLEYRIKVTTVGCTELSAIFCDDSHQLWSFPTSEIDKYQIYATQIELNSCSYTVRQFATGRRHCAVLVDFVNTTQQNSSPNQTITVCEKCKEDTHLRLSKLMENADEQFQDNVSTAETELADISAITLDDTPSTSQCNNISTRSRIGFNQIFSSIRSPFSKISTPLSKSNQKSEWYAIPSSEAKLSTFYDKAESTDIELNTLASERQNPNSIGHTGSIAFSFVSLDNLLSSSDNSSIPSDEELYNTLFEQSNNSRLHSFVSEQVANTFCEVWCFGANDVGQLGVGNTIPTRVPKRVKMPQGPVIKLCAGDNFTLALMTSGEIFGWGANENGQLKLDSNYLADPTPIKLGAKLCAIDVSAHANATYVSALSSENLNVVVCRFSKAHSKDQGVARLDLVEKSCLPLNIEAFGENKLLVGHLALSEENKAKMKESLKVISKFILSSRVNLQLAHLAQHIKDKVEQQTLNKLSTSIWKWTSIISQLAEQLRISLFMNGILELKNASTSALTFDSVMQPLFKLYFAYLDAVADSAFNDLNLSNDMHKLFEQLSLEYNTESSKESKRIRALFGVPVREFFKLAPCVSQFLAIDKPSTFWRKLENDFELGEKWAKQTAQNADLKLPNLPMHTLLAGFFEEPEFQIRSKNTSAPTVIRHLLTKQKNLLLIWTDALNVIQDNLTIRMEFPLLRTEKSTENQLLFYVSDPEVKIELEFANTEAASRFTELLNQAWDFFKTRRSFPHIPSSTNSCFFENRVRHGKYTFSAFHTFSSAIYDGAWLDNKPHGKGKLTYQDGRQYSGRFANGLFHGYGELLTGSTDLSITSGSNTSLMNSIFYAQPKGLNELCYSLKGMFKKGELNGLGSAEFLNGDSYHGYFKNNQMEGHGVYQARKPQSTYVGAFRSNQRHGYGVLSSNKERYLGEWQNDIRHGLGTIITIDGVFHEGKFEQDKFVFGFAIFETPSILDPTGIVSYEGAFSGLGNAAGKGTLCLNKHDKIVGTFNGNIMNLSIANATYSHNTETTALQNEFIMTSSNTRSKWTLHEDKKWIELFAHFVEDVFGINDAEFQQIHQSDHVPIELSKKAWDNLAATLTKIKQQKNVLLDDRLQRIPSPDDRQFSTSYYATVREYFFLAAETDFHPLHRLLSGVSELFNGSYESFGTTHIVYDNSAIDEFKSLLARCYTIARLLFVNLPPTHEMYSLISNDVDLHHDTESSDSASLCSAETMSIGSLENVMEKSSPNTDTEPRICVYQPTEKTKSNFLATPYCDFLLDLFFASSYAPLFTLYSETSQAADSRYWTRIMHLSSFTDAHLLRFLDVKPELWPVHSIENVTYPLDTFTLRVSAKNRFYSSAVSKFQELSCTTNPTNKLSILLETFSEITACTTKYSTLKSAQWSIDELLPVFIYVVVRAQVQHLGAEIRLLHDFASHVSPDSSTEIALIFTIFQSAYYNICVEKGSP